MSAGTALSLAASHAGRVTSFSATIDSTTSGSAAVHVSGQVTEQVKPVVLAREVFHVTTSSGQGLPGRMEVVLTGKAVYLRMSVLAKQVGKPWVRMSFASLKRASGISMAPLLHQLQGSNPLAQAQMLSVAKNVRQIGRGTVNGVPVTGYAGTLNVAQALARLSPQMRSELGPALSQSAARTVRFTAWVDDQHVVRKIVEIVQLNGSRVSTVITITAINQPVHIHAPPASQVARMPGL
jgi:hypothetical protein